MKYFKVKVSFAQCGKEEIKKSQPIVLLSMSLLLFLDLTLWAKSPAKHQSESETIKKTDPLQVQEHVRAEIIISQEADRSDICWEHPWVFYWVVMPCCILNEDEALTCWFCITNVVLLGLSAANSLWQYIFHAANKHIHHYSIPVLLPRL